MNGEVIPPEILQRGVLDRLPAGSYEVWLWPFVGKPTGPGVRVGISSGEERVQITVPKR